IYTTGLAQPEPVIPPLDKSPLDMSTYPANYPLLKIQDKVKEPLVARITYSRPQKNDRVIFGELLEYNTVWRFGANENTEIEFFKDVKINKVLVKKGKYSVFAIPNTDKWTIIFNKDLYTWGSFKYDIKKDILRVNVPVQLTTAIAETFFIYFEKSSIGFTMNAGWDNVKVTLPIL
ncbi:MAG: DUF2911 domain-containing protein, partial [Ferruginibacter sp.]